MKNKFNKELFIYNIKYMTAYNYEPEVVLYDDKKNKYFLIAYIDFVDFYDETDGYYKLGKVDEIFNYIKGNIVECDGAGLDFSIDIKQQSKVINNVLWINA